MEIKKIIALIKKRKIKTSEIISQIKEAWGNEEIVKDKFISAPNYVFSNEVLIRLFADFLQTVGDSEILEEFDLDDIRSMYQAETTNNLNLENHIELGHFYNNVLNDKEKAIITLKECEYSLSNLSQQLNNLKEVLK